MQDLLMQCHFLIHPKQLMHSKCRIYEAVFFGKLLLAWGHNYWQPLWEKEKPSWNLLYLDSHTWIFSNSVHRSFWDKKYSSLLVCWSHFTSMMKKNMLNLFINNDCVHFFFRTPQEKTNFPASSTLDGSPFLVNDFVISTSTANIAHFVTNGSELQVCTFS